MSAGKRARHIATRRAQQKAIRRRFRQVPWQGEWMFCLPKIEEEEVVTERAEPDPLW